ncbi:hypothetical protein PsYK624_149780 [Phanerochaete sordida]|uniref:Uncharacterized protein n=1 Tax=Phanerochaete sordida TaxID=48140 RepID=A0A9P3LLW8_9APHY|nr:hypothetical protein PsYK624_149780 [Phanerochaete sordida]
MGSLRDDGEYVLGMGKGMKRRIASSMLPELLQVPLVEAVSSGTMYTRYSSPQCITELYSIFYLYAGRTHTECRAMDYGRANENEKEEQNSTRVGFTLESCDPRATRPEDHVEVRVRTAPKEEPPFLRKGKEKNRKFRRKGPPPDVARSGPRSSRSEALIRRRT